MVEDGYEFFAKRQLVTLFSAPNYCGEFDNAGAMMSVDETLMCSFQVSSQLDTIEIGVVAGVNVRIILICYLCIDSQAGGRPTKTVSIWWGWPEQAHYSTKR